jgi:hypothetical protein
MDFSSKNQNDPDLLNYLKNIDRRLKAVEEHLNLEKTDRSDQDTDEIEAPFWFAKVGIVVLAIGIAFLLTFPYPNLPPALPSLFGYFLVGVVLSLSYFWKTTFSHISRYLLGGGMVLFYFTTLRLFKFSTHPALTDKSLEIGLLMIVVLINLAIAYKRESEFLTGLNVTLACTTFLLSENAYLIFITLTLFAGFIVYLKLFKQWEKVFIYGIILTQLSHFIWFINNPILGNRLELVSTPIVQYRI